jgi:mono/diheme cytochrome c family protein
VWRRIQACLGAAVTLVWLSCAFPATGSAAQATAPSSGWRIPESAAIERSPLASNDADLAKGRSLFRTKCQSCHGVDGSGHGRESDPEHPAGDLTDARAAARNPSGVLFYKVWNGRTKPRMPAMKLDLTRDDVWRIVAYVETLRK